MTHRNILCDVSSVTGSFCADYATLPQHNPPMCFSTAAQLHVYMCIYQNLKMHTAKVEPERIDSLASKTIQFCIRYNHSQRRDYLLFCYHPQYRRIFFFILIDFNVDDEE